MKSNYKSKEQLREEYIEKNIQRIKRLKEIKKSGKIAIGDSWNIVPSFLVYELYKKVKNKDEVNIWS